jgi:hypothetical protein
MRFEKGTVPQNSEEATPGRKISDRNVLDDVSGRSQLVLFNIFKLSSRLKRLCLTCAINAK